MDRRKLRKRQLTASVERINCWLRLAERMLRTGASPAERALRYSLHPVTGTTVEKQLKPEGEFMEIIGQFQYMHEQFYELEMDFGDETDASDLTIVDYNDTMRSKEAKYTFTDMEFELLRVIHNDHHVMKYHTCELPYMHVYGVAQMTDWMCNNALPQWVVDSESALEDVRTLFV